MKIQILCIGKIKDTFYQEAIASLCTQIRRGNNHIEIVEFPDEKIPENLKDIEWLKSLTSNEKVVAVGEIGLDYYYDEPERDIQKKWFEAQLELAREVKLPVIIHSRDAAEDTLRIMKAHHAEDIGGVIHCFSYSMEIAKIYTDMGFYLGIGGALTFNNSKKLVKVVENIPLERLVLETDAPYLTPVPNRGKRNSSLNLKYVVEKIAGLKGISEEEVIRVTEENAEKLYRMG